MNVGKKTRAAVIVLILLLAMALTACGRSSFGLSGNEEKRMTVTAEKAAKNALCMAGSLEVAEGEGILVTSSLTKGRIRVELIGTPEEQSIDVLPETDGEAAFAAELGGEGSASGSVPAGSYMLRATCLEKATGTVQVEVTPAAEGTAVGYGQIKGDFSGMTPEIAATYLAVVDDFAARLGYDEADASVGECLHGGFVRDWDGDGTPELCLLLKTSPRDPADCNGTPIYGWFPPTLYLYTVQNAQAVRAGECDLYFATGGREAAVAALMTGSGMRYIRWDRSALEDTLFLSCHELADGAIAKVETPADVTAASEGAETAQAFLDALQAGSVQLLLYNNSGEARIEGEANTQELRAALAAAAS